MQVRMAFDSDKGECMCHPRIAEARKSAYGEIT
jgi:hypothetical protein